MCLRALFFFFAFFVFLCVCLFFSCTVILRRSQGCLFRTVLVFSVSFFSFFFLWLRRSSFGRVLSVLCRKHDRGRAPHGVSLSNPATATSSSVRFATGRLVCALCVWDDRKDAGVSVLTRTDQAPFMTSSLVLCEFPFFYLPLESVPVAKRRSEVVQYKDKKKKDSTRSAKPLYERDAV